MGHRPIQQKNGPLTTEIAILNLERMAHTMVCPAITLAACHFRIIEDDLKLFCDVKKML